MADLNLLVQTFGARGQVCLGDVPRKRGGYKPIRRLTPEQIYNAIRGATVACKHVRGSDDHEQLLMRIQVLAVELVRRCEPDRRVRIAYHDSQMVLPADIVNEVNE